MMTATAINYCWHHVIQLAIECQLHALTYTGTYTLGYPTPNAILQDNKSQRDWDSVKVSATTAEKSTSQQRWHCAVVTSGISASTATATTTRSWHCGKSLVKMSRKFYVISLFTDNYTCRCVCVFVPVVKQLHSQHFITTSLHFSCDCQSINHCLTILFYYSV